MPPELHVHPDRLLVHAAAAARLSEELREALRGAPDIEAGPGTEPERLCAAVGTAARELAELSAVLGGVAAAAGRAETELLSSLRRLREALGPDSA